MKKSIVTLGLFVVLVMVLCMPLFAGEIEPNFGAYLKTLSDEDFTSAIVYLKDRPNIRAMDQAFHVERTPLPVRHEKILNALKRAADRSQPALLSYLDRRIQDGEVKGYTPYWIMNLVVVYASKPELYRIVDRPEVEAIEGNFKAVSIDAMQSDLGLPIASIGVTNSLRAINADLVWYNLGITGYGRIVGHLDTGVEGTHPALTDRWRGNWYPWQECWRDALLGLTTYPEDKSYTGHGTHTMGTLCGAGHDTGDTIGVAWEALWIADNSINQNVSQEYDNDILGAFQWFADPDGDPGTMDDVPDVVNNSWGIATDWGWDYQDCDYRWQAVIENCEAAGVVCIFAAGNEGPFDQTLRSPANICNSPTINFSVGAVDAENYSWPFSIWFYSSRGPSDCDGTTIKPEVVAPGCDIYSSIPSGFYNRVSGTSCAAPHVSGVVALMRQANPYADVQTIKEILMSTARDLGYTTGEDNTYGWGCIDAYEAVQAVMFVDTIPPEVTVNVPNGGEVWTEGVTYNIDWDATDDMGVIKTNVYYSFDGGSNYILIDSLSGNPGNYDWIAPNTPSNQCLVKVSVYDYAYNGAGNEAWDISDDFFTLQEDLDPPLVTVLQPNGGEALYWGTAQTITWNATDELGLVAATSIYYSSDGGANYDLIDSLFGNPGSYEWFIPEVFSTQCLVKVYAYDQLGNQGQDVSDNFFTIKQDPEAPVVTVLQPNGGEVLYRGTVYTITWNATDLGKVAPTSIYYSNDGGINYNLIDSLSGNPGSYNWAVSGATSTQCLIKVYAYDKDGKQGMDVSDNFFSVALQAMPYVWAQSIDLSITVTGVNIYAGASVTVYDQNSNPVEDAEVHSHWGGITSDSDVFSTNSMGVGTCISDKLKNLQHWPIGWWYFYVDDVIKSGYYFKSDIGETVDSIFQDQVPKLAESTIKEFSVSQNYPNPFNPVTQFSINLPTETQVKFDIYNVVGQKVRTLVNSPLPAGSHNISWDSTNERGEAVSAGVYFYRVVCGENVVNSKMLLLK
jgi:subtilisin family serine protease